MATYQYRYLVVVAAVSAFRVVMYIIALESVTSVKIDKKAWQDAKIQEVAYNMCKIIRTMMAFRFVVTFWGLQMLDGIAQEQLGWINFLFDVYLMVNMAMQDKNSKALTRERMPAFYIQLALTSVGIAFVCWSVFRDRSGDVLGDIGLSR